MEFITNIIKSTNKNISEKTKLLIDDYSKTSIGKLNDLIIKNNTSNLSI
jgi:hypothetical protein